jgi:hypothetical protein
MKGILTGRPMTAEADQESDWPARRAIRIRFGSVAIDQKSTMPSAAFAAGGSSRVATSSMRWMEA